MKANRKRYEPRLRWPDNPATAGRRLTPEEPAERGRSSSGAVQTDGVAILRDREERTRCWNGELLTSDRLGKAKAVVLDKLKPRKDGARASTIDGGMVIDRKMHVQAHKSTADAALVVLELVSKRFEGQALIVKGTDEFRFEAAQLAGMHGLNVTFTDPAMEQMRCETGEHKEMEKSFQAEITGQKVTNDVAAHRPSRGRTADLL